MIFHTRNSSFPNLSTYIYIYQYKQNTPVTNTMQSKLIVHSGSIGNTNWTRDCELKEYVSINVREVIDGQW